MGKVSENLTEKDMKVEETNEEKGDGRRLEVEDGKDQDFMFARQLIVTAKGR